MDEQCIDGLINEMVDALQLLFVNLCLTRANSAWVGEDGPDDNFRLYLRTPIGINFRWVENRYRHLVEGRVSGCRRGWDRDFSGASFVEYLIKTAEKVGG